MITLRSSQPRFAEGFIEEAVGNLWEPWMRHADQILEDEKLLNFVYEALVRRHPKSRTRGRLGTSAEIVVRMLLLTTGATEEPALSWISLAMLLCLWSTHPQLEFRCGRARSPPQPLI